MKTSFSLRTNNSNAEVKLLQSKHNLVHELVTSEIKYISYLKKVLKYFARPLIDRRYLPDDMHSEIFGRLVPILSVNETLLESVLTVGVEKAFLKISPCLKLYADYASRYQTNVVFMEVNSLDGLAETRLLVIMSDILICAKPRTQTELESIFSKKKCVYSRKYPNPFTQFYGRKVSSECTKHIRRSNDTNPLVHVPKFSKSISQSSNFQTFNDSTDFLTDNKVCFSCVAVYPLHHCHVQIHFKPHTTFLQPIPESPECQPNQNNSVFISPVSIGGFSRHTASTPLVFDEYAYESTSVVRLKSDSFITFNEDDCTMKHPEPLKEYNFTVHCRDANFTIVNGNLNEAEDWISSLETAIQAVKTARKSLRKESSAKWPMRASDFIQFEQWLEQKRIIEETMKSSGIFQRMGMEELTIGNPLSPINFLESSRMEQKLEEYRRRKSIGCDTEKSNRLSYIFHESGCLELNPKKSKRDKQCGLFCHSFMSKFKENKFVDASVLDYSNNPVRLLSITSIPDRLTSSFIPFNTGNHSYSSDRCYHSKDTHSTSFPSQLTQSRSGCLCM
ncbi:guanine-nucleotide-exchange-factor, putative [Schistosoma mansoni]|uniref:guanine-nucleotide-exchange-factor, putative n=1 Tax=Schistosoma mansoni TaxID=6183 RepID=UPI0001A64160|nr:guanine-nucleotide-exchange-factor, putative [Schistosoma mansoni]|eukprot:XP_018644893.1 guanine-nucleotide-exchange-factor, putative [Schistosoma mansoni]